MAALATREPATRSGALGSWAAPAGLACGLAGIAAAQGGYFPTAWGWAALGFLWAAGLALVLASDVELSRAEIVFLGFLTALVAWIGLSLIWSMSVPQTVDEVERALVYVAGAAAFLLIAHRGSVVALLGAVVGGLTAVCLYALATRLFPDRVGTFDPLAGYRLAAPLGYWNALGIVATMGALLAVGFAARAKHIAARMLASAALVVLAPTLYFTFSRGSWLALGLGLAAAVALDQRRLRLVTTLFVVLPAPTLAVVFASRSDALTNSDTQVGRAAQDGHRLALVVLVLAVAGAVATVGLALVERRVAPSRRATRAYAIGLVAVSCCALVALFVVNGSPWHLATRAYDSFRSPPVRVDGDLNKRLFDLSNNGRIEIWQSAWGDYRAHPWLGSGAGTYEQWWNEHRPSQRYVRDAHSLYLETLAELGPPGLVLLLALLAIPVAGGIRARRAPVVPLALGAYVAYLAHAAVDWDWEMPAVTLTALLCGLAALVYGREDARTWRPSVRTRTALAVTLLVPASFAFVAVVGNTAARSSETARVGGDSVRAVRDATRAANWAPWSARPWHLLARAQRDRGDDTAAAVSLRRATDLDPRNYLLWYELSFVTEGDEQRSALARALALNPRLPIVLP